MDMCLTVPDIIKPVPMLAIVFHPKLISNLLSIMNATQPSDTSNTSWEYLTNDSRASRNFTSLKRDPLRQPTWLIIVCELSLPSRLGVMGFR